MAGQVIAAQTAAAPVVVPVAADGAAALATELGLADLAKVALKGRVGPAGGAALAASAQTGRVSRP